MDIQMTETTIIEKDFTEEQLAEKFGLSDENLDYIAPVAACCCSSSSGSSFPDFGSLPRSVKE